MKLKPVDLYEIENIDVADTYIVYDCSLGALEQTNETTTDFELAKKTTLERNRKLVYAFNSKKEDSGALSRFILLTKENIKLYEDWKKNDKN